MKLEGRVDIIVAAGSGENEIVGFDPAKNAYRVKIKAPAQDNKANIAIIKFFSKLSGKKVRIIRGLKSKLKTLSFE